MARVLIISRKEWLWVLLIFVFKSIGGPYQYFDTDHMFDAVFFISSLVQTCFTGFSDSSPHHCIILMINLYSHLCLFISWHSFSSSLCFFRRSLFFFFFWFLGSSLKFLGIFFLLYSSRAHAGDCLFLFALMNVELHIVCAIEIKLKTRTQWKKSLKRWEK